MNYLYLCAFFVSMAGLLSGFDTGVISGALLYINKTFNINIVQTGLIVSCVSFGAIIGALINSLIVDKIGRKNTFLISAIFFMSGSLICGFSPNVEYLITGRIILGLALGIVSFVAPLYLSEISTKEKRGAIVSLYQLMITFGILFSYLTNYFCSRLENNWRIMLLIGFVPAVILFIAMLFQNDTPRWLVLKNKINEAKALLNKLHNNEDNENTIQEIQSVLIQEKDIKLNKKLIKPLLLGISIMFIQIATGINAIIYYTPTIFNLVGFTSQSDALLLTIFIGLINFLMTFVAIALVDKIGRKPLLYIGLSGMTISLIILSIIFIPDLNLSKYLALFAAGFYIVSFSISLGPVALLLISEIFPLKYRGSAMGISIVANFLFNFIVTSLFPISLNKIGGCYTFLIFVSISILSIFFIYYFVPETKNITLEEIEKRYSL